MGKFIKNKKVFLYIIAIFLIVGCGIFVLGLVLGEPFIPVKVGRGESPGSSPDFTEPSFTEGPSITFDEELFDFGKVPYDKKLQHVFRFRNVGSSPLVLERPTVKAIEGC